MDVEPLLTISDFKSIETNLKQMNEKHHHLEAKFDKLKEYLEKNSIDCIIE